MDGKAIRKNIDWFNHNSLLGNRSVSDRRWYKILISEYVFVAGSNSTFAKPSNHIGHSATFHICLSHLDAMAGITLLKAVNSRLIEGTKWSINCSVQRLEAVSGVGWYRKFNHIVRGCKFQNVPTGASSSSLWLYILPRGKIRAGGMNLP